jgi:hypothetical protein
MVVAGNNALREINLMTKAAQSQLNFAAGPGQICFAGC